MWRQTARGPHAILGLAFISEVGVVMHQHCAICATRDDHPVDGTKPQKGNLVIWMATQCPNLGSGAPIVNGDVAQSIAQNNLLIVMTDAQGCDVVNRDILIHPLQITIDCTPHLDAATVGCRKSNMAGIEAYAHNHGSRHWDRGKSRIVTRLC